MQKYFWNKRNFQEKLFLSFLSYTAHEPIGPFEISMYISLKGEQSLYEKTKSAHLMMIGLQRRHEPHKIGS